MQSGSNSNNITVITITKTNIAAISSNSTITLWLVQQWHNHSISNKTITH